MTVDLRPLEEQTIVITGASSGIGLTTARMAAERGARVVAVARGEDALAELVEELREDGAEAEYVVADVSNREDVQSIARTAEEAFGGFDTWVNCAAGSVYGPLRETPIDDMRKLFETNVWGVLYGSLEAVDHLEDAEGGALINVGSVASDRAFPLQGAYSASKHAVKGFTDALRMELEHDDVPVSVTLVKPAAIDTPYPEHAKNYMDKAATLPPPVYAPETVARAILRAAEQPQRDVFVGSGAKGMASMGTAAPRLLDRVMERLHYRWQRTDRIPLGDGAENVLDEPVGDLEARGSYEGRVRKRSLYTRLAQNRSVVGAALAGAAGGILALARRSGRREGGEWIEQVEPAEATSESGSEPGAGQLFADRDEAADADDEAASSRLPTVLAQSGQLLASAIASRRE